MKRHFRYADQQAAEALARLQHTVSYAQGGLNASVLINGGALIGLFTLVAPHRELAAKLLPSGFAFSAALLLTMLGWIFATISQDQFQISCTVRSWNEENAALGIEERHDELRPYKIGAWTMYAGYASIFLSVVAFVAGSLLALNALA